jgi:lipopolysaccharide/colanic/teichoic acid biosynthesis glycosyltransferase
MTPRRHKPYDSVKRLVDVVAAGSVLLLTAPLQLVVAALVRRNLGSPVLFRQQRPGLYGKPFTLVKFRTMKDADVEAGLVSDADRVTDFGAWLRSTSLDELPTLWNVVKGDMSLVGPRPLLMAYLGRYSPEQSRRHDVRPGITGLAQVRGRNAMKWPEKFAADVEYVRNRSLALDLRIIGRTVRSVLQREGISSPGEATMAEFMGNEAVDQCLKAS